MFPRGKDEDETNGFGRSPCLGNEQGSKRKVHRRLALTGSRTTNRGGVRVVWETAMAEQVTDGYTRANRLRNFNGTRRIMATLREAWAEKERLGRRARSWLGSYLGQE